jgi:nucleoside-diphosphate-sugar epimerase
LADPGSATDDSISMMQPKLVCSFGKTQRASAINIVVGEDQTIKELAEMVREAVGFEGEASGTRPSLTVHREN